MALEGGGPRAVECRDLVRVAPYGVAMVVWSERALRAELCAGVRADLDDVVAERVGLTGRAAELRAGEWMADGEHRVAEQRQIEARLLELAAEQAKLEAALRGLGVERI
jgi:hypothetical protein